MNIWFLSFADSRLKEPLKRIRRQARAFGFAEERTLIWTEHDLDPDFREKMKDHLIPGSRGYGYWCWKPQIVLQALDRMSDGDVLLYADAGCHLNPKGQKRFEEYVTLTRQHGILAFQARIADESRKDDLSGHGLLERVWTKGDLFDFFGLRDIHTVINSGQISGTTFLLSKCPKSISFFTEYRDVFYSHFALCDDTPSTSPNYPEFRENRHDQSVFSLLVKRDNIFTLSGMDYSHDKSFRYNKNSPVWAMHDKGGWRSLIPFPIKLKIRSLIG